MVQLIIGLIISNMKIYKDYQFASITMLEDKPFLEALKKFKPSVILETGTHLGTGSTKMLTHLRPKKLYTIECSYVNYTQAKKNLKPFPFVECIHGLSVGVEESKKFMALNKHIFEDDVFVDDANPIEFYTNEIMGMLNGGERKEDMKQDLIAEILPTIADKNPLILLDSAGGIGFLEFQKVKEIMGERPYTLVLDDTHHVKHYQSKLAVQQDPSFKIVYNDDVHGRLIAVHNAEEEVINFVPEPKPIYVILGRFGDIYMVAKQLKQPSVICCMSHFAKIVYELFPEHEVFEVPESCNGNPIKAVSICENKWPSAKVVLCQQDGQDPKLVEPFRSFQAFQEYYAQL
jgi:hypothetical protein